MFPPAVLMWRKQKKQATKKAQFPSWFHIRFQVANGFLLPTNLRTFRLVCRNVLKAQATGLQCASPGDGFPGVTVAMEATGWHLHCEFQHPDFAEGCWLAGNTKSKKKKTSRCLEGFFFGYVSCIPFSMWVWSWMAWMVVFFGQKNKTGNAMVSTSTCSEIA